MASWRVREALLTLLRGSVGAAALIAVAHAQDATWRTSPPGNDFTDGGNWSGGVAPTGTATFGQSSTTSLVIPGSWAVDAMKFNAGAPAYTFNIDGCGCGGPTFFAFTGAGIINNSSNAPTFNVNSSLLQFAGDSTAGNAIINANIAAISFVDNSSAGNATIKVADPFSILSFTDTSKAGNANIILSNGAGAEFSGAASAQNATIKVTDSELAFRDGTTADKATITASEFGAVGFLDDSTAGNATIRAADGGLVVFLHNSTGGKARFIVDAGGEVDFESDGVNGKFTAGSIEGAGTVVLGNNTQIGTNNLSTVFSGLLTECSCGGSLTKVGTGTLTISGTNNDYTGATTINGGVLNVTGSIASSSGVTINDGGMLTGTGRVSNVTVKTGGVLAPGTATPGTLRVEGNLAFSAGSNYFVHITPSAASRTDVTGTASLAGTVFAMLGSGGYTTKQFTILNATGGRSGKFDDVDLLNGAGFISTLTYTSNSVILNLKAALGKQGIDLGGNAQSVADTIDNYFNSGGALPSAFGALYGLTGSARAKALNQLTGETSANATGAGFSAANVFLSQMLNPFGGGPTGNVAESGASRFAAERQLSPEVAAASAAVTPHNAEAHFSQRWRLWATPFGGVGYLSGDSSAGTQDTRLGSYGIAAGADFRVNAETTVGFAVSGGHASWNLSGGLGSGDDDIFQVGIYGTHNWGAAYVGAAATAGWHAMTTDRNVTLAGGGKLSSDFDAQTAGGRIEAGYRISMGDIGVTPYAALQAVYIHLPTYSETPAGNAFALTFTDRSATTIRTELGSWFERVLTPFQDAVLVGRARAAWAHDEVSGAGARAAFLTLPGTSFVVNGAATPADSALLTAAMELRMRDNFSLGLRLDSELSSDAAIYGLRGELKKSW